MCLIREEEVLEPPHNFSMVEEEEEEEEAIYRSGFPRPPSFRFHETLHLHSVM